MLACSWWADRPCYGGPAVRSLRGRGLFLRRVVRCPNAENHRRSMIPHPAVPEAASLPTGVFLPAGTTWPGVREPTPSIGDDRDAALQQLDGPDSLACGVAAEAWAFRED